MKKCEIPKAVCNQFSGQLVFLIEELCKTGPSVNVPSGRGIGDIGIIIPIGLRSHKGGW